MTKLTALLSVLLIGAATTGTAVAVNAPLRATLVSKLPGDRSPGDHVLVRWKLRDSSGHAVTTRRVTLKIVCPTGDAWTTTVASLRPDGTYRANAVVPAGGIGTLAIRAGTRTAFIKNPFGS